MNARARGLAARAANREVHNGLVHLVIGVPRVHSELMRARQGRDRGIQRVEIVLRYLRTIDIGFHGDDGEWRALAGGRNRHR